MQVTTAYPVRLPTHLGAFSFLTIGDRETAKEGREEVVGAPPGSPTRAGEFRALCTSRSLSPNPLHGSLGSPFVVCPTQFCCLYLHSPYQRLPSKFSFGATKAPLPLAPGGKSVWELTSAHPGMALNQGPSGSMKGQLPGNKSGQTPRCG